MTREELDRRLDELAGREDFVASVEQLAAGLDEEGRAQLQELLVARAEVGYALRRRIDEPRFPAFHPRPREPGRR